MMLCVDSSGLRVQLCLTDAAGTQLALVEASSRDEASRDFSALYARLRSEAGLRELPELILAGRGPGSFIGTRVALSFANGLAVGGRIALRGFDSLQALRLSCGDPQAIAIRDARRGQFYICDGGGSRLLDEEALREAVQHATHIVSDALPQGYSQDRSLMHLQDLLAQCPGRLSWLECASPAAMLAAAQPEALEYVEPVYLRGYL